MTRTECEAAILRKMHEINEIYKTYNPDGDYLSMTIYNGHYNVNNSYQDDDKEHPLNAWYRPDEYQYPYYYERNFFDRTFFDIDTGEVIEDAPES